jgi:protocatechuate 3,4-dioxygenase, alpha subunit
MTLAPTPGQTVGPFFGFALPYAGDNELVPPTRADAIRLHGRVYDGAGDPVPDALIELWQAAPDGSVPQAAGSLHRDGYTFTGWGRSSTDRTGHYQFTTVRPGATTPGGAPYFALTVFARGLLDRLFTRAYLPGAAPERWPSLEAAADDRGFVFDVRLQGEGETVFLTYPRH